MSFETDIPMHIATCEKQILALRRKRLDIDWGDDGHECDCEYCDHRGEDATEGDPEAQDKADAIDNEIVDIEHTIASLKAHAAVHKVQLAASQSDGGKP